jgi:predicted ABC-type ATPase
MTPARRPTVTIVAGPNGAGKSTLTAGLRTRLMVPVIDPDAIARALSPDDPASVAVEAGREAIRRRDNYLATGESFIIETTLSGRTILRFMTRARQSGYTVELVFISVENAQTLIDRIAGRVAQGGHHVPEVEVRRRYARSLRNLPQAVRVAVQVMIFDNSAEGSPQLVLTLVHGRLIESASSLPLWVSTHLSAILGLP